MKPIAEKFLFSSLLVLVLFTSSFAVKGNKPSDTATTNKVPTPEELAMIMMNHPGTKTGGKPDAGFSTNKAILSMDIYTGLADDTQSSLMKAQMQAQSSFIGYLSGYGRPLFVEVRHYPTNGMTDFSYSSKMKNIDVSGMICSKPDTSLKTAAKYSFTINSYVPQFTNALDSQKAITITNSKSISGNYKASEFEKETLNIYLGAISKALEVSILSTWDEASKCPLDIKGNAYLMGLPTFKFDGKDYSVVITVKFLLLNK